MIVAVMALFVALCGSAYAVGVKKNSVGSKQIKDGGVTGVDVKNESLTGADVNESTLSLPAGLQGEPGPQGPAGSPDTAAQVLAKLLTVDGPASGLDADTVDGSSASAFLGATAAAGGDLTGNYPNPTVGSDTIGAAELSGYGVLDMGEASIQDPVGGGTSEAVLINAFNYQIVGRCTENPAGTVAASMEYRSAGTPAVTSAVDSTMPGGVNDLTTVAHTTEATLSSQSASAGEHILAGDFGVLRVNDSTGANSVELLGKAALTTNFGSPDCRFKVSVVG